MSKYDQERETILPPGQTYKYTYQGAQNGVHLYKAEAISPKQQLRIDNQKMAIRIMKFKTTLNDYKTFLKNGSKTQFEILNRKCDKLLAILKNDLAPKELKQKVIEKFKKLQRNSDAINLVDRHLHKIDHSLSRIKELATVLRSNKNDAYQMKGDILGSVYVELEIGLKKVSDAIKQGKNLEEIMQEYTKFRHNATKILDSVSYDYTLNE